MNKLLLLFIIFFSSHLFSQNSQYIKIIEDDVLKNVTTTNFKSLKHSSSIEKTLVEKYDSIIYWSGNTGSWVKYGRLVPITYDGSNNLTSSIRLTFDGTNWINDEKNIFTYDGNHNKIGSVYQLWDGAAWYNSIVGTYTYDGNHNMLTYLYTNWNGIELINLSKGTYVYNGSNKITSYISEYWDAANVAWVNDFNTTISYVNVDYIDVETLKVWDTGNWVNSSKTSYAYAAGFFKLNMINETWDTGNNVWVNVYKDDYVLDGLNKLTDDIYSLWSVSGANWVNSEKTTYSYISTTSNIVDNLLKKTWDGLYWNNATQDFFTYSGILRTQFKKQISNASVWSNKLLANYTYDANSLKTSDKVINYTNNVYSSGDSIHYYFGTYDDGAGLINLDTKVKSIIYPNPTNDKITINSKKEVISIEISNIEGLEIKVDSTVINNKTVQMDLKGLTSGFYFIKIETDEREEIIKVILN